MLWQQQGDLRSVTEHFGRQQQLLAESGFQSCAWVVLWDTRALFSRDRCDLGAHWFFGHDMCIVAV